MIKSIIRAIRQRICRHDNMKLHSYRNNWATGCIIANFECKKCLKVTQVSIDSRDFDLLNRLAQDNQQLRKNMAAFRKAAIATGMAAGVATKAFQSALSTTESEGTLK